MLRRAAQQWAFRRPLHTSRTVGRKKRVWATPRTPSVEEAVINILHNTPEPAPSKYPARNILSCLAHNEPGVISRVSGILQSRGFNIESLVAAHTELPGLSRMTVVLNGDHKQLEQAKRQLEDLVPMWAVLDYSRTRLVERELLLIKVSILGPESLESSAGQEAEEEEEENLDVSAASRKLRETSEHLRALTELTRLFEGKILDVSSDSVIIELSAKPDRITSFIKLCKPFGVLEASRTGVMALPRTPVDDQAHDDDDAEDQNEAVDATMLPPG